MIGRLKQCVTIVLLVSFLGVAWAGQDQEDGRHRGMSRGHHGMMHRGPDLDRLVEHMSRRLELDETQEQAITNIVEAARPEAESLRDQAKANREAMHALDYADADYDVKLQNLAIRNGELATQLTLLHGRVMQEVDAELTDEQRAKLAEGKDRMRKRFRHHRRHAEAADDAST